MKVSMKVDYSAFVQECQAAISKVQRGTKKATKAACEDILKDSLNQVPRETDTLAKSAFYEIQGSYRNFTAIIGYGGNGDPINPKTGVPSSEYMVAVHENLEAIHPVGKAKFLEDPVNSYTDKLPRTFAQSVRDELKGVFKGGK